MTDSVDAVSDLLHAEDGDLVVPAPVSAEVDYLIRRRGSTLAARAFLRDVAARRFRVEGLTEDEHGIVARLDEQYADLDLGLADLSVVILAHRFQTRRLLTFDERDFRAVVPLSGGSSPCCPVTRRTPDRADLPVPQAPLARPDAVRACPWPQPSVPLRVRVRPDHLGLRPGTSSATGARWPRASGR